MTSAPRLRTLANNARAGAPSGKSGSPCTRAPMNSALTTRPKVVTVVRGKPLTTCFLAGGVVGKAAMRHDLADGPLHGGVRQDLHRCPAFQRFHKPPRLPPL